MGDFMPFKDKKNWRIVTCMERLCALNWFGQVFQLWLLVLVSIHSHHVQVMECCAINEWIGFEFMSWFLFEDHESVDLCYMICACPFVSIELHLLPINMLVELSFDFRG
jgi:hypothetical protein